MIDLGSMTLLLRIDTIVPAGIKAVLNVVMPMDRRDHPEQDCSDRHYDDERRDIAARVRRRGPLGLVVVGRQRSAPEVASRFVVAQFGAEANRTPRR